MKDSFSLPKRKKHTSDGSTHKVARRIHLRIETNSTVNPNSTHQSAKGSPVSLSNLVVQLDRFKSSFSKNSGVTSIKGSKPSTQITKQTKEGSKTSRNQQMKEIKFPGNQKSSKMISSHVACF